MTKEDLIPIRDHETAVSLGTKGGSSKGTSKQIAAKLREAKKKGNVIAYMMELSKSTNPEEAFSWMLENYVKLHELVKKEKNQDKQFSKINTLMQRQEEFTRLKYGEKHKVLSVGLNHFYDALEAWRIVRAEKYQQEQHHEKTI